MDVRSEKSGAGATATVAPVLAAEGICKAFNGVPALVDAELVIRPGEVHGLLGANGCGKSTLIKILSGVYTKDAGTIAVNGAVVDGGIGATGLRDLGLSFVHQDLGLTATATVLENFALRPQDGGRLGKIAWGAERARLEGMLTDYGLDIDVTRPTESLSPVERALVAIIRALDTRAEEPVGARLLVLDEPTVFLPRHDVERLQRMVQQLAARGDAVLLVSHDLDEVLEMADRVTVLRDGRNAGTVPTSGLSRAELVAMILGSELAGTRTTLRTSGKRGPVVLRAESLTGKRAVDVDLTVHAGEVVGLTGLAGSGYDEVVDLLYGSCPGSFSRLDLEGRPVGVPAPRRMIGQGVVLVPADRKNLGGAQELTVLENMALPLVSQHFQGGVVRWRGLRRLVAKACATLRVKPQDPSAVFSNLSGGNQQKTIIGKWLEVGPRLLLLNEPTQGVDVGARAEIFQLVRSIVADGAAVVCATSDYEQLLEVADRVVIFREGRVWGELSGADVDKDQIASAVYGY
jgi:ribose transport system ATP-binding protein